MTFWVYIVKCSDGTLYTGYTNDIPRRLRTHNQGRGSRYTRARLPVLLAYCEKAKSKRIAQKREAEIKKLSRSEKLLLCAGRSKSAAHSFR